MISEQTRQRMRDLAVRYPVARSAIMPALSITQQEVCTSISCYLRNCDALAAHLESRLGIKRGETSAEGTYTLLTTECLASYGTAPILQVNDEFVERVTLEMADAFIDKWKKESEHLCQN